MSVQSEELMELISEAKELSAYIAILKCRRNIAKDIKEKDRLTEEIKSRQYQAVNGKIKWMNFGQ